MAYFRTCKNCKFEKAQCDHREFMRGAIKGLGITSIKFNCAMRARMFEDGQRVLLKWRCYDFDEYDEVERVVHFRATVVGESASRLRVILRVDPGASVNDESTESEGTFKNENLIIKARHEDITPIDEPLRKFCKFCLEFDGEGRCQYVPGYRPDDCWRREGDHS